MRNRSAQFLVGKAARVFATGFTSRAAGHARALLWMPPVRPGLPLAQRCRRGGRARSYDTSTTNFVMPKNFAACSQASYHIRRSGHNSSATCAANGSVRHIPSQQCHLEASESCDSGRAQRKMFSEARDSLFVCRIRLVRSYARLPRPRLSLSSGGQHNPRTKCSTPPRTSPARDGITWPTA